MLIFDVETGPLPIDQILAFAKQFVPPPHPGEFDPSSVKIGNLKDRGKIDSKIEEARQAHAKSVTDYDSNVESLKTAHERSIIDRAALDPVTGRVVAIGYYSVEKRKHAIDSGGEAGNEDEIIANFWKNVLKMRSTGRKVVGANIFGFDLPFLVRRSWILGVEVPSCIRDGRYWDRCFICVREIWLLGQRWGDCESSLDTMARALDCGAKPDGVDGSMFWQLWSGSAEDRAKAIAYLQNDLDMTWGVAQRIGVA